ncbi:MAG: hypothetical protein HRU19_01745 [Pseudobacteriovorax sp.]|nr:hypothetical protein [Pseudobacteriovorax sp.]
MGKTKQIVKPKPTAAKAQEADVSSETVFVFDAELNSWVRVEKCSLGQEQYDLEELVLSEKSQGKFWFAW